MWVMTTIWEHREQFGYSDEKFNAWNQHHNLVNYNKAIVIMTNFFVTWIDVSTMI